MRTSLYNLLLKKPRTQASILEKLYEQPSTFGHRNVFINSPLKRETYDSLLGKADWLMILDQNLKSWDVSLQSTSERLYYKSSDYRSIGIYSRNSRKFALGYQEIIAGLGNYVSTDMGVKNIISAIRSINDDGLLSIVSHSTNQIFDQNHGKGSLGLAITAILYMHQYPDAVLVGLDTQLAREWLADREDGKLPDLIGIRFSDSETIPPIVDLIEAKTYDDYKISAEHVISGHAVDQVSILEELVLEMFGRNEKITTVSRREILREQVFECLFNNTTYDPNKKQQITQRLNNLFSGQYSVNPKRNIFHVAFSTAGTSQRILKDAEGKSYQLLIIGSDTIRSVLTNQPLDTYFINFTEAEVNAVRAAPPTQQGINLDDPTSNKTQSGEQSIGLSSHHTIASPAAGSDTKQEEPLISPDLHEKCVRLNVVLKSYGIQAHPVNESLVQQASRFTRFKLELKPGETEANLKKRSEDIARELEAAGEIFISRINGTRYIGLDVPFADSNQPLMLVKYLDRLSGANGALSILAGQSPDGEFQMIDLAKAPHMLIAGTTGSGKTIFLYSIIVSLLQQHSADELELLIVDPKQTDFHFFEGLPHLRGGRVLTDADEAIAALTRINAVDKQERTDQIKTMNSRDIDSYNAKVTKEKMKRLVIVIDEYADLVQAAELQGKDLRKTFESKYSLYAVPYKRSYIVLNTSMANRAVEISIQRRQFSFLGKRNHILTEHNIDKYKTDLYIEDTKTIIEVKSVISLDEIAKFPTVFSERSLVQLVRLKEFLADGYNVHYCIVSLNPYVKGIQILRDTMFREMLQVCLLSGMTISAHTCRIRDGRVQLENALPISLIDGESP